MQAQQQALRKAAILVSCLDMDTADALLDQMDARQAALVRQAVMTLGPVETEEQDDVIASFLRIQMPADDDAPATPAASSTAPSDAYRPPRRRAADAPPFGFLHETTGERLTSLLKGEHPQTIALVISHLPAQRAGGVLATLRGSEQAEVLRRLVELEEADPEALADVERGLQERFKEQFHAERRRNAGLTAVEGIVRAASPQVQRDLLGNLATYDSRLAARLAPPPVEAPPAPPARPIDMERLSDSSLRQVAEAVDDEVLVLALAGMSTALAERLLRQLPEWHVRKLRQAVDSLGPTRLSDLEEAQRRLAETAGSLAAAGRLQLPTALMSY